MKKCKYSKKYKGLYPPRCDDGFGCDACWEKWRVVKGKPELVQLRNPKDTLSAFTVIKETFFDT